MASSGLTACGSQGQSIHKLFFRKVLTLIVPSLVKKNNLCFSVGRHLYIEKGALKLIKI